MTTDKIQEELEKEIEEVKEAKKLLGNRKDLQLAEQVRQAKLSQHLATKQAMIKDEIEFLESIIQTTKEREAWKYPYAKLCERLAKLNAEKQKLGIK